VGVLLSEVRHGMECFFFFFFLREEGGRGKAEEKKHGVTTYKLRLLYLDT
jgi:hypothetical protein